MSDVIAVHLQIRTDGEGRANAYLCCSSTDQEIWLASCISGVMKIQGMENDFQEFCQKLTKTILEGALGAEVTMLQAHETPQ